MLRIVENLVDRACFNNLASAHHNDPVTHTRHHAHIVRDQGNPGASFALQLIHQIEHLSLHGHIESCGWLVGQKKLRPAKHGNRNHNALPHAARKLVRELIHTAASFRDTDMFQPINANLVCFFALQAFMKLQDLAHLGTHGHMWCQARQRILEDHRHSVAANIAQRLRVSGQHIRAFEHDRARCSSVIRKKPHRREHGLAFS